MQRASAVHSTGRLIDRTAELGLADGGRGKSAELLDLDADGNNDLLLHNAGGDVIFWSRPHGYERDGETPIADAGEQGTQLLDESSPGADRPLLNCSFRCCACLLSAVSGNRPVAA